MRCSIDVEFFENIFFVVKKLFKIRAFLYAGEGRDY